MRVDRGRGLRSDLDAILTGRATRSLVYRTGSFTPGRREPRARTASLRRGNFPKPTVVVEESPIDQRLRSFSLSLSLSLLRTRLPPPPLFRPRPEVTLVRFTFAIRDFRFRLILWRRDFTSRSRYEYINTLLIMREGERIGDLENSIN